MTKAANLLGCRLHFGCLAHTLNLAVQKALKVRRLSQVLARIRRIVSFFHRSALATALLKEKAALLGLHDHKLKTDVSTRWNSAYDMLLRYIEMQAAVTASLRAKEMGTSREKDVGSLSDEDYCLAEEAVTCLKPLKDVTTMLCTETSPTVSIMMPLYNRLMQNILVPVAGDSNTVKEMKDTMATNLYERYDKQKEMLNITSALDPRFKALPYASEDEKRAVFAEVTSMTIHVSEVTGAAATGDAFVGEGAIDAPAAVPGVINDVLGDAYVTVVQAAQPLHEIVEAEVKRYQAAPTISLQESPLKWWRQNEPNFIHLAKLARCLLGIPATSVPSERVFSTAGDIVTQSRSRLKSKHVDMLIFLKKNM